MSHAELSAAGRDQLPPWWHSRAIVFVVLASIAIGRCSYAGAATQTDLPVVVNGDANAGQPTAGDNKGADEFEDVFDPIRGVVVNSDGRPVADAKVVLRMRPWSFSSQSHEFVRGEDIAETRSDARGRFEFRNVRIPVDPPISDAHYRGTQGLDVVAVASDHALGWTHLHGSAAGKIVLGSPATLRGQVIDEDGQPVPGAEIRLKYLLSVRQIMQASLEEHEGWPERDERQFISVTGSKLLPLATNSDASGRFALSGLPSDVGAILEVVHPDFQITKLYAVTQEKLDPELVEAAKQAGEARERQRARRGMGNRGIGITGRAAVQPSVQAGELQAALRRGHHVVVNAVFADTGQPAPFATFTLSPFVDPAPGTADERGRCDLRNLESRENQLMVYAPRGADYQVMFLRLVLQEGNYEHEIVAHLPRGVPVTGRVVDARTKRGIPDVHLMWWSPDMQRAVETSAPRRAGQFKTDDTGSFHTAVAPGTATVCINATVPGYRPMLPGNYRNGDASLRREINVSLEESAPEIVFEMTPAPRFSGRVFSPAGKPAPRAEIVGTIPFQGGSRRNFRIHAGADGSFELPDLFAVEPAFTVEPTTVIIRDRRHDWGAALEIDPDRQTEKPIDVHLRSLHTLGRSHVDDVTESEGAVQGQVHGQDIGVPDPSKAAGDSKVPLIEREIGVLPFQHDEPLISIAWLDQGKSLFTTSRGQTRVWDVAKQAVIHESIHLLENRVYASTDRSGRRLAITGSESGTKVLEWPSGNTIVEMPEIRGGFLALSPDGKKLAVTSGHGYQREILRIFDADTAELLDERVGPPASALCWSPDSRFLAAGENRGIVFFLKPDGTLMRPGIRLDPPEVPVALAFDDAGKRLAIVTIGGTCGVWKMADRKPLWTWKGPMQLDKSAFRSAIRGAAFAGGGKRLFAHSSYTAIVFDAATGKVEVEESAHNSHDYVNIVLSPDGKMLAKSTSRNAVELVDVSTLQPMVAKDIAYPHLTRGLRLSRDHQTLLALGEKRIDFWSIEPLRHLGGLDLASSCEDACWSPNSRLVAVACPGSNTAPAGVEIIDVSERKILRTLPVVDNAARGVAFAPDGQHLAVAEVRHIALWDVAFPAKAMQIWRVPGCAEADRLDQIAFSPDGGLFAAIVRFNNVRNLDESKTLAGGGVRLFRIQNGRNIGEFVTEGTPNQLEFPDDATLAVGMDPRPRLNDNGPIPVLVEWNVTAQQLIPDRSTAFVKKTRRGVATSLFAKQRQVLVSYDTAYYDPRPNRTSEFGLWNLDPLREIRQITLPCRTSHVQLLPGNRIAGVKPNGNLVIFRAGSGTGLD